MQSSEGGAANSTHDGPRKRQRPSRGVRTKVVALEGQMQQVQASLNNVTHLLQRVVANIPPRQVGHEFDLSQLTSPSAPVGPVHLGTQTLHPAGSLEHWVEQITRPATTSEPHQQSSDESDAESSDDVDHAEEGGMHVMKEILRKEQSARLKADGHSKRDSAYNGAQEDIHPQKRKRSPIKDVRSLDPVDLGMCSEAQGRELFNLFFQGAHTFIPVYDPNEDTWESLRRVSPFSITVILFVGKKIQDAGRPESELQTKLREHAENIGKSTLFSPIASLEALQAMVILASWGDTGWRPGSHAISIGFDMELYKCLPRLAERTNLEDPTPSDRVPSRELIVGARLWLLVSKVAIEMAYNHGRPLGIREGDILSYAHALLNHPAALPTDSRIIAACELLLLRLPLHEIYLSNNEQNLDRALQMFNDGAQAWELRWRQYYVQRGTPAEDILVSDLITQRCFSSVLANSSLLRHIKGPTDVSRMPSYRKRWLLSSLQDAQLVIASILATEKHKLLHANHYSHVALASVSRVYMRLATLFPEAVDLRRTAKDLTQLVDVMEHLPMFDLARQLRNAIRSARIRRVLPPETRPTSPQLPGRVQQPNLIPSNRSQSPLDFDLFAAEHWFNQELDGYNRHATSVDNQTNYLSWLDFPALEQAQPAYNMPPLSAVGSYSQEPLAYPPDLASSSYTLESDM